jgi:hypothetical protein
MVIKIFMAIMEIQVNMEDENNGIVTEQKINGAITKSEYPLKITNMDKKATYAIQILFL